MKFSLVLGTLGRTEEVQRFLTSLNAQGYRNFELIVIDQNPDDRLCPLVATYSSHFPIVHLRSSPGLSHARNVGLAHVSGDIVAFPDDDCWYPNDLLQNVSDQFLEHSQIDGLTGRSIDEHGKDSALKFGTQNQRIDRFSAWINAISYTIFLRRAVVEKTGLFDEALGVGSATIFGSGEETDYILRALQAGFSLLFLSRLAVHHPDPDIVIDRKLLQRTYAYGCGMGRVLDKHAYPLWYKFRVLIRPFGAAVFCWARSDKPRASLFWNRCAGRFRGMRGA